MRFALVFPGQGSQSVAMMNAYGEHPVLRACFDEASEALGRDLWSLAAEGPVEAQNQTINTQPLMLTAGVAVWRLWREKGGGLPQMVAGHSLGEYTALVVAGVLTLRDAVPLVEFRAKAMQEAVPAGTGAMAAILGLDAERIKGICAEAAEGQVVEAVNFNAPEQTVIAGDQAAVARAAEACKGAGAKRAVMLPVSAPFHCALMRPAAERLGERLSSVELHAPTIPVLNNVDVAFVSDPAMIREALVRQAASPVRWVETMRAMQQEGVTQIYECGPGKVLAGLVKRCAEGVAGTALADLAALEAAVTTTKG
ncbi:MAG: ACP S-malonyltransferase [Rhodocyclaceae bacterium]|nr:ACP S-malonyltransferase [Rhodocyclaceae bacterium]